VAVAVKVEEAPGWAAVVEMVQEGRAAVAVVVTMVVVTALVASAMAAAAAMGMGTWAAVVGTAGPWARVEG
jgi:hypothetical protein